MPSRHFYCFRVKKRINRGSLATHTCNNGCTHDCTHCYTHYKTGHLNLEMYHTGEANDMIYLIVVVFIFLYCFFGYFTSGMVVLGYNSIYNGSYCLKREVSILKKGS